MPLPPGTRLGQYEITDLIGTGGMGEVYRARDSRLDRTIALKVLPSVGETSSAAVRRFDAEARAASAVAHPNVAHIYDVGEQDGIRFIAMEFVEGRSLADLLETGRLPISDAVGFAAGVSEALAEAHRKGVVHRDIKPANIVVTAGGRVKVLDFGVATMTAGGTPTPDALTVANTAAGMLVGTPRYMSPEQALGRRAGPAADVFALGVVLYEMLAGHPPFASSSVAELLHEIAYVDPRPLTAARSDIPAEVQRIVRACLEKRPESRIEANELAAALRRVSDAPTRVAAGKASIVVLPFDDLSAARDNQYFSDGLADEITLDLSNIQGLSVMSRTSARSYRDAQKDIRTIAAELNVRYVMEGSVRKSGDAVRITARVFDADTSEQVWGEKFSGSLSDVFEIQERVAKQIAEALRGTLSSGERASLAKRATTDGEAFDLYLRGRHLLQQLTKRDLLGAISLFERALQRDPRYATAYAGLAQACASYHQFYDAAPDWLERAIDNALKALTYDAHLPEAYAALALSYFAKGNLDESLQASERAVELDPHSFVGYWTLGCTYAALDREQDAIEQFRTVIDINPEYYPAYFWIRMMYQRLGTPAQYEPLLMRLVDEVFPRYLAKHPDDSRGRNSFGMELAHAGRLEHAREEVERALRDAPDDPLILYATACYQALWGDRTAAMQLLQSAVDAGFRNVEHLRRDPDLRALHDDPRYAALIERLANQE